MAGRPPVRQGELTVRHYLTDPETGRKLYAPGPEDDSGPALCDFGCGEEVPGGVETCAPCLARQAEKEADAVTTPPVYDLAAITSKLDPRVARILSAGSIVEPATDAREVGREPTSVPLLGAGSSLSRDLQRIWNHLEEAQLIISRMKGTP